MPGLPERWADFCGRGVGSRIQACSYLNERSLADISVLGLLQAELDLVYDDNGDASINPRYGAS